MDWCLPKSFFFLVKVNVTHYGEIWTRFTDSIVNLSTSLDHLVHLKKVKSWKDILLGHYKRLRNMKVTVVLIIGSLEMASHKASKEELETNKEESITKIIKSSWILESVLEYGEDLLILVKSTILFKMQERASAVVAKML